MVSPTLLCCPQATWTWGPDGHGAILLVNCDCDDPKSRLMGDSSEPQSQLTDNRDTVVCSYEGMASSFLPCFLFLVTFLPNLSSLSLQT